MNFIKRTVVWLNVCVLFCLFNNVRSDFYDTPGGAWPSLVEIGVGDNANITCWMNPTKFSNNTVKDLYFENINTREQVPKADIIILNKTAIVWMLRDAKEQKTTYRCKCGEKAIMDTKVYVGYKPLEVIDFTCRSYDYSRMQCNFTKPDNPVLTLYNISFHFATNYRNYPLCNFEKAPLVVCEIEKDSYGIRIYRANQETYHFTLIGINPLGELTQTFLINNYKIMVPVKPGFDFRIIQITSHSASFSFRMPKNYPSKSLQWEVILKPLNFSANNVSNAVRSSDRNEFVLDFENLDYAYYEYQLYLRVCLREAQLWSDPFVYKFRTAPRRPRPPRIDIGSFYIDPLETTVRLYWELLQPHEFDGDNFNYVIENGIGERISTNNNSASFLWDKTLKFVFTLYSKNHFGLSDTFSKITIPAMVPYGKSKTHTTPTVHNIYHGTNGTYTLTWEAPEITNNLIDYTVFWCRSKRASYNDCEGSIHFKHVSRDVNKFTTAPQEHTLNLAVSANYKDFNTGMHWTECTMNEESDLVKMEPEVEAISATAIKIQWGSENICPSIFERYNLSYCEVQPEEEKQEDTDAIEMDYVNGNYYNNHQIRTCIEDTIRYVLINKTIHRWELHELKPYTSYKIEMFMYSLRKLGKTSDPQYVLTDEGAPTPPRQLNVSHITNTSAIISWLPPREPNGKIRTYTIVLNNERRQIAADPNDLYGRIVYDMKDLNSSTSYKVYVLAETILSSQPSNDIHFTTHVGYPSIPSGVEVKDSNIGATIGWAKATERTDFYEVAITVMQNDKIVQRRISIVMASNFCAFNIPQCLDPNYRTTIDVRAVNAALLFQEVSDTEIDESYYYNRNNEEQYYEGNNELRCINKNGMTQKQITSIQQREQELYERFKSEKYRLFKSDWHRGTTYNCSSGALGMIFVYIASAVLITVGAFVLMYLMRQKYNKMANIHCTLPAGLDAYMSKDFSNVNGNFPHDFIAVIKGEMTNTRTEENNITMHRKEKRNEERRLLETSQDSISNDIQTQKQIPQQDEQLSIENEPLPALSIVDLKSFNEIGIISNPINDSNFDLTSLSKTESDCNDYTIQPLTETVTMPFITASNSPYIQANEIATTSAQFPQPTQNCYIKPNALSNWHNTITALPTTNINPGNGYITVDNIDTIPKPISKDTTIENSVPTNNGYIQTNVLLDSMKHNLNTQSNAVRNLETTMQSPHSTDSYTTFEQLNKMSPAFLTSDRPSVETQNFGLTSLATNFTPGISGYVTHRELNEFGRQHQQNNLN